MALTASAFDTLPVGGYIPRVGPAAAAVAVYSLLTLAFLWSIFGRFNKQIDGRWFLGMPLGTACITVGYILRLVVHYNPHSESVYTCEVLFILLPPCLFFWAGGYRIIGRLANVVGAEVAKDALLLKATWISRTFVTCDVLGFLIQGVGGGVSVQPDSRNVGHAILLSGLSFQLASLSIFWILSLIFGLRMCGFRHYQHYIDAAKPSSRMRSAEVWFATGEALNHTHDWRTLWMTMLATTGGYVIRSVYRIIEYQGGYYSTVALTESYFYIFDSLDLAITISVFLFVWPPLYCQHPISKNTPSVPPPFAEHRFEA